MDEKKQIAFYYDGELAEDETIVDMAGTEIVPGRDQILRRRGKEWKVSAVMIVHSGKALPTYKVYLVPTQRSLSLC
jgi:hypothetical protein